MKQKTKWMRPIYPVLFPLGESMSYVKEIYKYVDDNIDGALAMDELDASILGQAVYNGRGVYLEYGSLFGGSAIIAAMVIKKFKLDSFVICVDDGEMTGDTNVILKNADLMGVGDIVYVVNEKTNMAKIAYMPAVTLVDASHDYGNCLSDIVSAEKITRKYIVIHDYDPAHREVMLAAQLSTWIPVLINGHTIVLENPHDPKV